MDSPRCSASIAQAMAPTRATAAQMIRCMGKDIARADGQAGRTRSGSRCAVAARLSRSPARLHSCPTRDLPVLSGSMPLPSFGFGHRPSWEYEAPDGSGAVLEEPEPQPIRRGWKGKVAIVTGGATGLGRAMVMEFGKLGCNVAFCFVNMPGRDVSGAGAADGDRPGRDGGERACRPLRRARPRRRRAVRGRREAEARRGPLPGEQRGHRERRRALAVERGGLARGASTPTSPAPSTASARSRPSSGSSTSAKSST